MSEEPVKNCPECGKDVRRIIFGGAGIIFKGSGFYVNDSKGKNSMISSNSKTNSQTGDASGGDASAGNADKKTSGDTVRASSTSTAAAGSKAEPKAGAKESA